MDAVGEAVYVVADEITDRAHPSLVVGLLLFGECCCRRSFQPGDCIIISLV